MTPRELASQAARARRNADLVRAEWLQARADGDRTVARGARLLWSILERTARESERAAAGASVDREGLSLAAGTLASLVRQDVAGGIR